MRHIVRVVALLALVACEKESATPSDGVRGELTFRSHAIIMMKMVAFKDLMCACKDAECTNRVGDEMNRWSLAITKQYKEPPKLSEAETQHVKEIFMAMVKCMMPAMSPPPFRVDPEEGKADGTTQVWIMDTSFVPDDAKTAKVYFGDKQGKIIRFATSEQLVVEAPAGKVGETVDVVVETPELGRQQLPHGFRYVDKH